MKNKAVNIVEFPSNLGLLKKSTDAEPGVKGLPDWLNAHGLYKRINPVKLLRAEPPPYSMDLDKGSGVRNVEKIISYAREQAEVLGRLLDPGSFQLIIGGDCSILIGCALALKRKGRYGLFYVDGHTDFITPELSQTGGAAGMDLAIVTGHGHDRLTNIDRLKPYFEEANVYCVGNREYDAGYVRPVLDSGITYFDLKGVRSNGMDRTARGFLEMQDERNLDGFLVHLDVDVLSDEIMPAVDSRQEDGLGYNELSELLLPVLSSPKAIGIEITILDPTLDKAGVHTANFVHHISAIFDKSLAK